MAFPVNGVVDDFARTNSSTLGGAWSSSFATYSSHGISSNQAVGTASASRGNCFSGSGFNADQEAYITCTTLGSTFTVYLFVRTHDITDPDGYAIAFVNGTSDNFFLGKMGSDVQIIGTYSQQVQSGDSVGISASGSTITAYYKASGGSWTALGSAGDTTFSGSGYAAWDDTSDGTANVFDNFGAGNLSVTPPPVSTPILTPFMALLNVGRGNGLGGSGIPDPVTPSSGCVNWRCTFEDGLSTSNTWNQIQAPQSYSVQSNTTTVRTGASSARFEVRQGDVYSDYSGERAELAVSQYTSASQDWILEHAGTTMYYTVSVYIPTDWTPTYTGVGGFSIFLQEHGPNDAGPAHDGLSPALCLNASDIFYATVTVGDWDYPYPTDGHNIYQNITFSDPSLNKGNWTDFVLKVKHANDYTGEFTIWKRNTSSGSFTQVASLTNIPTMQYQTGSAVGPHYWKCGIYRDNQATAITNILYEDCQTRGSSYDACVADAWPT